jgi:Flp pilus assembly protein TadB
MEPPSSGVPLIYVVEDVTRARRVPKQSRERKRAAWTGLLVGLIVISVYFMFRYLGLGVTLLVIAAIAGLFALVWSISQPAKRRRRSDEPAPPRTETK